MVRQDGVLPPLDADRAEACSNNRTGYGRSRGFRLPPGGIAVGSSRRHGPCRRQAGETSDSNRARCLWVAVMNLLAPHDLVPAAEYEQQREQFRSQIIALKQRRRISVGPLITLVFENRETLRFQTQEMIRVEHILDPHKVQEELDVYNALMPGSGE